MKARLIVIQDPQDSTRVTPLRIVLKRDGQEPVRIDRSRVMKSILSILAEQRVLNPGQGVDVYELWERTWPQDPVDPDVGARRVHRAVFQLRSLSLGEAIVNKKGEYLLHPDVAVEYRHV